MTIVFPALLAGPIIRRVDVSNVYIWMATSKHYDISAEFFEVITTEGSDHYSKIQIHTETETIQFGKNLFIHLIKINPINSLPTNCLIGYNFQFAKDQDSFDLGDLGLLTSSNPNRLIYGNLNYPCFFIPEKGSETKFLYGSCRKPHGDGEDTLVLGDRILEENCRNLTNRPEALFLMGDQIYADDVADPLFQPINQLGYALMGAKEDLSMIVKKLARKPHCDTLNKANGRTIIMEKIAKFTSGEASNHLIRFGDYAAMYLLAFSPVLWELSHELNLFEPFEEAVKKDHIHLNSKSEKLLNLQKIQLEKRYKEQEKMIQRCHSVTYQVRRLLANIPTYMIFDDHDITDDWNITAQWKERVYKSPLGKHIVTNGLSAYWAFQGWGNQPDHFNGHFISRMRRYFQSLRGGKMKLHYHRWCNMLWEHRSWHFVTPTSTTAVFLDTRTMRMYEDNSINSVELLKLAPPQLINDEQYNSLAKQLYSTGWEKGSPLIIVSPTPVIGFDMIEKIVTKFASPLNLLGIQVQTVFDVEAWKYNGKGLTKLFRQLTEWNPSQCIILSGDVHYGYSVDIFVTFSDGKELTMKQITSSPLKNMSFHHFGKLVKTALTVDQMLQRDGKIYQYCDLSYKIHKETDKLMTTKYLWEEQLNYQPVDGHSIIETENNLGLLIMGAHKIQAELLKHN